MLITREDIQRIGDVETLMHFLEEKLNLPIPKGATLEQLALPLPLTYLGLGESMSEWVIDCQDFSGLSKESLGERRPFLIRFGHESCYPEILREIARSLHQKSTNPADLFFICANEHFQPFAFAYFNDSTTEDWHAAVLNILIWTQGNTRIHTSYEHRLSVIFPPGESSVEVDDSGEDNTGIENEDDPTEKNVRPDELKKDRETSSSKDHSGASQDYISKSISPENLLAKLKNTGAPLSQYVNIYSGILTGHNAAFVIDESQRQKLIDENTTSSELIKPLLVLGQKWKTDLAYLIWIPSSQNRTWPWSNTSGEVEAKRIFEESYPAISEHLDLYEDKLRSRSHQGKFYWEFAPSNFYSMSKFPKIVYPRTGASMRAAYDTSGAFPLFPGHFIPTEDLSLLAILNSSLFDWYVQTFRVSESNNGSDFKKAFMDNVPIAARTQAQKSDLSHHVQQILAAPDSLAVHDFEKEIDELVYELYELTEAEIALITGHQQPLDTSQDTETSPEISMATQQINQDKRQTQTDADRLLAALQNTDPQQVVSPPKRTPEEKITNRLIAAVSSDDLLDKLQNTGTPLKQYWNIYTGITPGCVKAFVIDEAKGRQMISIDPRNSELIKPLTRVPKAGKWKVHSAYLIWISNSQYKQWPWSDAEDESEAERIFEDAYPVISQHLIGYRNILKNRNDRHKGKFYWELSMREPIHKNYAVFYHPKIVYPIHSTFMNAFYDSSESIILGSSYCIPTDDLSLLAILNSTLFGWYAQFKCRGPSRGNSLLFTQENMLNVPIAPRTSTQRSEISHLVQQILDAPNSPNVRNLEEDINMLVYDLYELTSSEIALIEEESNP